MQQPDVVQPAGDRPERHQPDRHPHRRLSDAPTRTPLVLVGVNAPIEMARRLGPLGLRPGAQLEILHRTAGGGQVISVAGSRIALGREVLRDLDVEVGA